MLIIKMKELKLREAKYLPHTEQRAKLVKVRTASEHTCFLTMPKTHPHFVTVLLFHIILWWQASLSSLYQ